MRYLVVLHAETALGKIYATGKNDGLVKDGEKTHPVLDCLEVSTENPHYLYVVRDMTESGVENAKRQTIYIPHHSVVMIYLYDVGQPRPLGFLPH